nr:hypothetical protein [Sphingopyxis indica]
MTFEISSELRLAALLQKTRAQHLLCGDLRDRPIADTRIGLVEKPADLAECDLSHAFALVLLQPFLCDELETIVLRDRSAGLFRLALVRDVEACCNLAAGFLALSARVGEAHFRPGAE